MSLPSLPNSFSLALEAVQRLLSHFPNRGVVIGGVAASLLGIPRATFDIDVLLVLSIQNLPTLVAMAAKEGFKLRTSDAEAFARKTRVLLLTHSTSGVDIDISLGILPFEEETVGRSRTYQLEQSAIQLPTPEDLIVLKAVAHRPKDLEDIRAVIISHPDLDWRRIEHWIRQFAEVLERPEIWEGVARLKPKHNQ